jgi:hypothetical protein
MNIHGHRAKGLLWESKGGTSWKMCSWNTRRNIPEIHGFSAGGTCMGSAQKEHSREPCKRTFMGKSKEELHGNSALGIVMGTDQEEHS